MSERAAWLRHPLLDELGIEHGFGLRTSPPRSDVVRPLQVQGVEVARLGSQGAATPREADAIVSVTSLSPVGVVTADCVPLLVATGEGEAVAAIHAGWRGLAAGVVAAGIGALAARCPGTRLVAAIGPHIGACCYEVDEPVVSALAARFGDAVTRSALRPCPPSTSVGSASSEISGPSALLPPRVSIASPYWSDIPWTPGRSPDALIIIEGAHPGPLMNSIHCSKDAVLHGACYCNCAAGYLGN